MTLRTRLGLSVLVSGLTCAAWLSAAPQAPTAPLTQQIPTDPAITTGTYPNGLRYYIRANPKPEQRAELRLVVNAGSILEDEDQRGLAHFVEHMAFNGTKHFPKLDIVNFMESIGMRFGADLNAYTSFDETVYMLKVPTDKPDVLDKSLLVLEDWAQNVSFDDAEIDKERGVVMEEWRLGRGAGARMQDKEFPVLLKGSRYATRLPIGTTDVIQNAKHDRLKQFYSDWYRPDLMAVVAVGDFDVPAMKALFDKHFASIPKRTTEKPRAVAPVPDQPGTRYTIATDKEATNTSVTVYNLLPLRDQTTIGAYRRQLVESMFAGMLSARFSELAQKPDPPFIGAGTGRGLFVRSKEATTIGAGVKDDGVLRGLETLFEETARVAEFGFTATELDRQKKNMLRAIERAVAEKDKQESGSLADEYIRNFTDKEPIPGIVYENGLYQRFIPEITLAEINALAADWNPDRNRVVAVNGPDKPGLVLPNEKQLAGAIATAASKPLTAYVDSTGGDTPLVETPPTAGSVVKTSTKDALGITEWELSNGVKVVLKPTTYKADEVVFRAFSPGGTSLASDADFVPAETADQVVASGGLGRLSMIDLRKALAGKAASVRPFIDDLTEGVAGGGSPKDLETIFQLIYLTFTAPRKDATLFGVMTSSAKAQLANQKADPEFAFGETLQTTLAQNHPRAQPITAETIDKMNLDKSFDFYKDRLSDASDFTFVFVGSFDLPAIKPLVEKYLASLPATHRKETWRDVGIETPPNVVEKRVEKGLEPKSQTAIVFSGPFEYEQMTRIQIRAMSQILEDRLREILREDLGGTYSVSVSPNYVKQPKGEYQVSIEFGSAPDRADGLIKAIFKEIDAFKANGPTDKQLNDEKEGLIREYETNIKQNGYVLSQLSVRYEYGEDLTSLFSLPDYYKRIDAAMVRDAARKYLNTSRYVQVSLFPAKKDETTSSGTTTGAATTTISPEAPSRPSGALLRGRSQWPAFGW